MSFPIKLASTTKRKSSTKLVTEFSAEVNVVLKEDVDIIRPIFFMEYQFGGTDVTKYNYCHVPMFNRYYFIVRTTFVTSTKVQFECEVDVLATFRDDILKTDAFIVYAQSGYDNSIFDGRLTKKAKFTYGGASTPITAFDETGSFVLTAVSEDATGELGAATSFAMGPNLMAAVGERLFSTDAFEMFKRWYLNPMECIISCKWTPIKLGLITSGSANMTIGGTSFGTGYSAKKRVGGSAQITVPLKYTDPEKGGADYRNSDLYADYSLFLPGVGILPLTYDSFAVDGVEPKLNIIWSASPITGDIIYTVSSNFTPSQVIGTVSGNFGVDIPMASGGAKISSALSGIGTTAIGAFTLAAAVNPAMAVGGAITMATGAVGASMGAAQRVVSASGSLGGFTLDNSLLNNIFVIVRNYELSDTPSNIARTIGCPVQATRKLSSFKGLVKCVGAHVQTWATAEEHDIIAQMINNSANYIYGGFFVE